MCEGLGVTLTVTLWRERSGMRKLGRDRNGSFSMTWVTAGHKIENEVGMCIDLGSSFNELCYSGSGDQKRGWNL